MTVAKSKFFRIDVRAPAEYYNATIYKHEFGSIAYLFLTPGHADVVEQLNKDALVMKFSKKALLVLKKQITAALKKMPKEKKVK